MRKLFLDNIRWCTVCLVLIYHVCYLFNGVGVPASIPNAANITLFDNFACFVYPWFMVLLFVAAGISARYSLQKRTSKQFIKERALKLLIPSTLGLFVLHWVTGYIYLNISGTISAIPKALIYPISAISGTGPLWFIQMLFIFSCIILLLRKIDKKDRIYTFCEKINYPVLILLFLPVYGSAQILNLPVLTTYRFGIYFAAYLIGYYIFSHEKVQRITENFRIPSICLAIIFGTCYIYIYHNTNYTADQCLQSIITNVYLWFAVLAIFGFAKKFFNKQNFFCQYMTESGYGIYILHYPILLAVCCVLHYYCQFPAICNYIIAFIADAVITFSMYEIIKRIPVIRCLVLGIKPIKTKA